jgi:hypothetical protein
MWNATPYVKLWIVYYPPAEDPHSRHVPKDDGEEKRELWKLFSKVRAYQFSADIHKEHALIKILQVSRGKRIQHAKLIFVPDLI